MENLDYAAEYRKLQLQALTRLEGKVDELQKTLTDVGNRLSVMEGQAISDKVSKLEDKTESQESRLTKMETRGTILSGGISMIAGGAVAWAVSLLTGGGGG